MRVPTMADLDGQLKFINTLAAEDTFIWHGPDHKQTSKEEKKWLSDFLTKIEKDEAVLLSAFIDGKIVANTSVKRLKRRERHMGEVAISVADGFREEGVGQKVFKILLNQAKERKYKILCLYVFAQNTRAIHIYEKFGFKKTGILPKGLLYKGKYVDEVLMYKEL